jgi:RAB protein geranylgeranyltransferase component A
MDKNVQLLLWGAVITLCTGGIAWMISTLISVDKRTEVMHVKLDHLVQSVEQLTERQASYDQSWTNALSNLQASRGKD